MAGGCTDGSLVPYHTFVTYDTPVSQESEIRQRDIIKTNVRNLIP